VNSRLIRSLGLLAIVGAMVACTNQVPPPVTPVSQEPVVTPTPGPSQAPGVFFRDDFDGNALDEQKWKIYQRAGVSLVRDGKLELLTSANQPNFPYLLSRTDIIPETGPYYYESSFAYKAGANYQPIIALDYLPAEAPNEEALTTPFMRSFGHANRVRTVFKLENGEKVVDAPAQAVLNHFYVTRLEFDGQSRYRFILDGVELATFESKRRPKRYWFGSYPFKDVAPGNWPHMLVDYVAAGVLTAPASAAPLPTPTPSPSPSPSPGS
jgi:hypothetical protein